MDHTLTHHGILGQKWGIRRFQNKDGGLTTAGKKRYAAGSKASEMTDEELIKANKRQGLENQYNKNNPDPLSSAQKSIDQINNNLNRLKDNSNQRVEHERLNVDHMSDQELRNAIQREQLERQYSDLFGPEKQTRTKGQQYVQKALDVGGDILTVTSTALTVALLLKQLKKD